MKMKPTKLAYFQILEGTPAELTALGKVLNKLKTKLSEDLPYNIEFLITNNNIILKDVDYLVEHLKMLKYQK